MQAYIVMFSIE